MPLFIAAGVGLLVSGVATWNSNKKASEAAAAAEAAMQDEIRARNEAATEAAGYLNKLAAGEIPIPIEKVEVEKGKIGEGLLDALETAKSDEAINQKIKQSEKALSAQLNVNDPRVKAAVAAKAVDQFNDKQAEIEAEGKEDIMTAQTTLGTAQTENEQDFARRKQEAEADYANQVNSFVQDEYNRLQGVIQGHEDANFGLAYGAATVGSQQAAMNAANTAAFAGDAAAIGMSATGGTFASGGKLNNQDALMAAARGYRAGGKFSLEEGGRAAMTQGEFNHGDPAKPETGNDQVLLDQEDLKRVMDEGGVNNFNELMEAVPPQAVTTGGELIFNDEDSGNIESLTENTKAEKRDDVDDLMDYGRGGKRKKKKKKSKKEIQAAEAALAAYMRNLLAKEQFQG
tara:strand:- start:2350 stop:3552 length:1203 start_codon:yes stop_codon:yes gene_type:complete